MTNTLEIHKSERNRIAHDLHHNIHRFLDEVKGHVAQIEEEIKQLEARDLTLEMNALIEEAYQKVLRLKLGNEPYS